MARSATEVDPHHGRQLIYHGYTVLLTRPDGTLDGGRLGLFDFDTRILSRYSIRLDGRTPRVDASGSIDSDRWVAHLTVDRSGGTAAGPVLPQDVLEIELRRRVGNGLAEMIVVRNHSMAAADTVLEIELDSDFRDLGQLEGRREDQPSIIHSWDPTASAMLIEYHADRDERRLDRALRVRVERAGSRVEYRDGCFRFPVSLPPRGTWCTGLRFESLVDGQWRTPFGIDEQTTRDRVRERWRATRPRVITAEPIVDLTVDRAAEDLFSLRLWEQDCDERTWIPSAGLPTYTGVFGRDILTASWQAALLGPEMLRGGLARVAMTQSREDSAWRDAEPGKMVHEMRRGPLAELEITPQRAYYGTQTSSSMFVVVLSEYWHWTGDIRTVQEHRGAMVAALDWAERYGDLDGDGFLEYRKRSARGLKNQAWKDSDEAIRYPDGTIVDDPIATIEEQAYHCTALARGAELLLALEEPALASRYLERARALQARFHRAYWVPEDHFYAIALDAAKQPVRSISSNPGHALAAGLVPAALAETVADRLLAPDLFSGWGIRTLSSTHPSYNPLAYHLGTVWPVENATFALGFKRYGLDDRVERLVTALFTAASHFRRFRLPEALGGHDRSASPLPTVYPESDSPQAWSASATIQLVQTMLGLYPFAPGRVLALVRPALPSWLDTLTVRRIRVGDATVSIRFARGPDGTTSFDVIEKDGTLFVVEMPPPQDVRPGQRSWVEGMKTWLVDHAPGHTAAALRIALGEWEL